MNIVLIGFMGSGKSSVAKVIAEKTGKKLVEMDELIVEKSGRKDIPEIFALDGELKFREIEIEVSKEVSQHPDSVISTGGGVVMNKIILDYFKRNGKIVFLQTRFTELASRVENLGGRPLFANKKDAKVLFDFRTPLYQEYADLAISTDNKSVDEITETMLSMLKIRGKR